MRKVDIDEVDRIIAIDVEREPLLIPGENLKREGEISEKRGLYLSEKDIEILSENQWPEGWNKSKFVRFSIRLTWFLSYLDEDLLEHVENEIGDDI